MKPPSIVIDHFLSTKWSKKLFTINHYELQNGKCIVTQELSAYEERHAQKMTQQEISDITGIQPSNLARFESGGRVPTLVVLEKYANALGKHIEIEICDD